MSNEEACYLCSHVFNNTKPILYVAKEEDEWQFLCGDEHDLDEIPHVVGINHIFDNDDSFKDLVLILNDFEAERIDTNSMWCISKLT